MRPGYTRNVCVSLVKMLRKRKLGVSAALLVRTRGFVFRKHVSLGERSNVGILENFRIMDKVWHDIFRETRMTCHVAVLFLIYILANFDEGRYVFPRNSRFFLFEGSRFLKFERYNILLMRDIFFLIPKNKTSQFYSWVFLFFRQ